MNGIRQVHCAFQMSISQRWGREAWATYEGENLEITRGWITDPPPRDVSTMRLLAN